MSDGIWSGLVGAGLLLVAIAGVAVWWRQRRRRKRVGDLAIEATNDLVEQAEELARVETETAAAEAETAAHEAHQQIVDEVNDERSSLVDVLRCHGAGGGNAD